MRKSPPLKLVTVAVRLKDIVPLAGRTTVEPAGSDRGWMDNTYESGKGGKSSTKSPPGVAVKFPFENVPLTFVTITRTPSTA
jgi:hypothetical protein